MRTKNTEFYTSRHLASWRERETDKAGTLKPFSTEELEHIILLNNHLKALTSAVIDKTLRLSLHALDELHRGNAAETKELYNNEHAGHGRLWNELWYKYHISLSWAFGHFFNHLFLFTVEDIMKLKPENFDTKIELTV